ncbi:acylphosphatase [Halobacillus campisalis]|uniref:acylphosphatase n=1 Tax=Halobacillus campisalis TaxID=435909 RepID=A0ABW2K329_9BACI|nr:acylphosphatase [Halobacillus campisalis]
MPRKQWVFHGRVQGVGFRATAQSIARQQELTGWVRNKDDGSVEIEAEGKGDDLEAFLQEIKDGPSPFIKIDKIDEQAFEEEEGHKKFKIVY